MNINKNTKFWVVTNPTKDSTLEDILFECDLKGLRLQFLGGLSDEQIYKIYEDKEYATMIANSLLVAMQ